MSSRFSIFNLPRKDIPSNALLVLLPLITTASMLNNLIEPTLTYLSLILYPVVIPLAVLRGIFFPLKHGLVLKDIFPFQWIRIGLVGSILDLIKAPGYIIGAIWKILKI